MTTAAALEINIAENQHLPYQKKIKIKIKPKKTSEGDDNGRRGTEDILATGSLASATQEIVYCPESVVAGGAGSRKPEDLQIQQMQKIIQGTGTGQSCPKPVPVKHDFKKGRENRQKDNNTKVFGSIKNNNQQQFLELINTKEYNRTLNDLSISPDDFWRKCIVDDMFAKLISRNLSKNASRQGSNDEKLQLEICNQTTSPLGIFIENLSGVALRPTKDGSIITKEEMKNKKIEMDCCLKSFDGKISGKFNGYISAKVAYGSGGHQDNVFEEMGVIAEWWRKFKINDDEHLILLVDTDLLDKFESIRVKYEKISNIRIFNHYQFQEYVISSYYDENI
jgi:hypothetical protein